MINSRFAIPSILFLSALALSACNQQTVGENSVKVEANLSAKSEVPPVVSNGNGDIEMTVDKKNNKLMWEIKYEDLTGAVTAAHFHGPAMVGENASVVVPIDGNLASPIKGKATVTAAQITELLAGKWYVNLHTEANPDGEIRGQLMPKS